MSKPTVRELVRAAKVLAAALGVTTATYRFDGRVALPLADGWSLAISPDYAGRFRLEACHSGRVVATMWCMARDRARLAELAVAARSEAAALVA